MDVRDEPNASGWVTATATGGIVCGLVTAAAIGAVLGSLREYQMHGYADPDLWNGFVGSLTAAVVAACVIAVTRRIAGRSGARWARPHAVVPLVLVPAAVIPLVSGAERDNLEAGLIWGVAAVAVHVLLEHTSRGGRWVRWTAAALVLSCAAAGLLTLACQPRWRAQRFEAVGLPLYVPQVPGYRLTTTWTSSSGIGMALDGPSGERLLAFIGAPTGLGVDCRAQGSRPRLVAAAELVPEHAIFCLRDDAVLRLERDPDVVIFADVGDLLPGVTLRRVDATVLAAQPDNWSLFPALFEE